MSTDIPNFQRTEATTAQSIGAPQAATIPDKARFLGIDTKDPKEVAAKNITMSRLEGLIKVLSFAAGVCLGLAALAGSVALAISPAGWAIAAAALIVVTAAILVGMKLEGVEGVGKLTATALGYMAGGFLGGVSIGAGVAAGAAATVNVISTGMGSFFSGVASLAVTGFVADKLDKGHLSISAKQKDDATLLNEIHEKDNFNKELNSVKEILKDYENENITKTDLKNRIIIQHVIKQNRPGLSESERSSLADKIIENLESQKALTMSFNAFKIDKSKL